MNKSRAADTQQTEFNSPAARARLLRNDRALVFLRGFPRHCRHTGVVPCVSLASFHSTRLYNTNTSCTISRPKTFSDNQFQSWLFIYSFIHLFTFCTVFVTRTKSTRFRIPKQYMSRVRKYCIHIYTLYVDYARESTT